MVKEVIWPARAQKQLEEVYEYILKRSYQNAEKVKADILASTRKLADQPEMHPRWINIERTMTEPSERMRFTTTELLTELVKRRLL